MDVEELLWLEPNEAKLATHGISRREVEALVEGGTWAALVPPDYPEQVRIVGPTPASGRFITAVLDPTEYETVWRPVTGWPSTDGEIAYYRSEYP